MASVPVPPSQRVAVGRGARDLAGRDRAAGAAAVLDHDLLAERRAHGIGDDARHHVVAAAGGYGTISVIGRFG